ncbi:hypothetical protein ACFXTI_028791 [Malus domestica]
MPLHPSLLIVVISLRGQAAHFSLDRLPEGPDSRLGPDPQLLRQAFEGQGSSVQAGDHHGKKCAVFEAGIFPLGQHRGWTGRSAVGGVRNHEPPGTRQASPKVCQFWAGLETNLGWVPGKHTGWSGLAESQPVFSTRCWPLFAPVELL